LEFHQNLLLHLKNILHQQQVQVFHNLELLDQIKDLPKKNLFHLVLHYQVQQLFLRLLLHLHPLLYK
jgi:hypothetical protein